MTTAQIAKVFDADNHYWEPSDAFTRHRNPAFAERGVQVKEVDGVVRYVVGNEVLERLPGPGDVHPRPNPGAFMDYFKGKITREVFLQAFTVQPSDRPEWYRRDERLKVMDAQGVEATWLFPSHGVVIEAAMHGDIEAALEVTRAFNRWIEEDWGFAYKNRIFGVPYMNLSDPALATQELRWCIEHGARVVALRHGAALTVHGWRSPADAMFDPFWGLAQEAGVVVAAHDGNDDTYDELPVLMGRVWGEGPGGRAAAGDSMRMEGDAIFGALLKGRIVHDFAYILVAHRLFERFPRLRIAFIENGGHWVPSLLHALDTLNHAGAYRVNPKDQFIQHCWVAPFVEESVSELARHLPVDRILFGSDWPHGEGFPQPMDFLDNITEFSAHDQQRIMFDNAYELTFRT